MLSIMHDELHLCKAVAFELAKRSLSIALARLGIRCKLFYTR